MGVAQVFGCARIPDRRQRGGRDHLAAFGVAADGARMGAAIAVVIGAIGLLAESITATGAAVPLGTAIEHLAFGSIWVMLVLTAVMCILLGAGVPTVGLCAAAISAAAPLFGFGDAWLSAGIGLAGGTFVAQRTLKRQEVRSGRSSPPSP